MSGCGGLVPVLARVRSVSDTESQRIVWQRGQAQGPLPSLHPPPVPTESGTRLADFDCRYSSGKREICPLQATQQDALGVHCVLIGDIGALAYPHGVAGGGEGK